MGKEEQAADDHEQQETEHVKALGFIDRDGLFVPQFKEIVERLQNRRTDTALHPRGNFPVEPGQQPADDRRQNQVCYPRNNV